MALSRCPRCELNYLMNGEKICSVCRRDMSGAPEQDDILELCSECGENPVVPGGELCAQCLKENARRSSVSINDDTITTRDEKPLIVDSVSDMNVIELDDDLDSPFANDPDDDDYPGDDVFADDLDDDEDEDDEDDDEDDFDDED